MDRVTMLRPAWHGEPGWPVLFPTARLEELRGVAPDRMPPEIVEDLVAIVPVRVVEMGDPGVIHDVDTAVADLPAYEGPPDPPAGHSHEWGADVAAEAGLTEP
jgi:CTP:molybdopterin cytidylyltransferase MocA